MTALLERPAPVEVERTIGRRTNPTWKRALDLMIVMTAAPLIAPVLGLVAIFIKVVSPGPVLFRQSRVGYTGERFVIYKFRTMHVASESRDNVHRDYVAAHAGTGVPIRKPEYASELIPGGSLIRKLSIDEFPQLLNVLRGNMSIVGPRPDLLQVEDYETWQLQRFEVLPGMTGLWQISGKNRLTFEEMIELDIQYAGSRSLLKDLKIILMTFVVIFRERNE
jgi:lipopolysaccharide/colanic/teichoic acid biosynthesis glycosyltransferase